jgi:hypothetical protein
MTRHVARHVRRKTMNYTHFRTCLVNLAVSDAFGLRKIIYLTQNLFSAQSLLLKCSLDGKGISDFFSG